MDISVHAIDTEGVDHAVNLHQINEYLKALGLWLETQLREVTQLMSIELYPGGTKESPVLQPFYNFTLAVPSFTNPLDQLTFRPDGTAIAGDDWPRLLVMDAELTPAGLDDFSEAFSQRIVDHVVEQLNNLEAFCLTQTSEVQHSLRPFKPKIVG